MSTEKWTAAQFREYQKTKVKPERGNKFGAVRATWGGRSFDSIAERDYAIELDMLRKAGEIKRVGYQYKISLESEGRFVCFYRIDFRLVMADNSIVFCEFKGVETDAWKIKWALLKAQLHEIEPNGKLWLVKKIGGRFETVEVFNAEKIV